MSNAYLKQQNPNSFQEQSVTYQSDEKRYEHASFSSLPRFDAMTVSDYTSEYRHYMTTTLVPHAEADVSTSDDSLHLFRDSFVRTIRRLDKYPTNNDDHYIATGGILFPRPFSRSIS